MTNQNILPGVKNLFTPNTQNTKKSYPEVQALIDQGNYDEALQLNDSLQAKEQEEQKLALQAPTLQGYLARVDRNARAYMGDPDWTDFVEIGLDLLGLLIPQSRPLTTVGKVGLKQGVKAHQTGKKQGLFNKPSEELLKQPPDLGEIPVIGKIADKLGKSIEKGVNSNTMNAIVDAGATGGKLLGQGAKKIISGTANAFEASPLGGGVTRIKDRKFKEQQAIKEHRDNKFNDVFNSKTPVEARAKANNYNKEYPHDPISEEVVNNFIKEIENSNTSRATSADQLKNQKVETEIAKGKKYQAETNKINTQTRIYEETHNQNLKKGETVNALDIATKAEKLLNERYKGKSLQSQVGQNILKEYILSHREQGHVISNEGKVIKNINEFNKALKSSEEINTQTARTNLVNNQADKAAEGVKTQEATTNLVNKKADTQVAKTDEIKSKTNLNQGKLNSNNLQDLQTIGRIVEQHVNIAQKTKTNPVKAEQAQVNLDISKVNLDISKKRLEALKGKSFEDIVKYLVNNKGFAENIINNINKANKKTTTNPSVKEPQNKQTAVDKIVSEFKPKQKKSQQTQNIQTQDTPIQNTPIKKSTIKSTKPEKSNKVENIANNISPNIKTNQNNNANDTWVHRIDNNQRQDKKPPKIEEKKPDNTITPDNQESVQNTPLNAKKKVEKEDPGIDISVGSGTQNFKITDQDSLGVVLYRTNKAFKRASEYYHNRAKNGTNTQKVERGREQRIEQLSKSLEYIERKIKEIKGLKIPKEYKNLSNDVQKFLKKLEDAEKS